MPKLSSEDWTQKTYVDYGDLVFDILTAPPPIYKNTPEQVGFIEKIFKRYSPKAKKILDVPCGDGRISLGLLKKGYGVTGLDISPGYIKKANSKAKGNKKARFLVGDMRELDFCEEFDAVINWFGSFGYFDDQTNEEVLRRFVNSLTPKGLLILDLTNRDYIIQRMGGFYEWQPEVVLKKGRKKLLAKYEFDPFTNRIEVTIRVGKEPEKIYYRIRYYNLNELVSIVVKHSMRVVDVYGDYQGNKYSLFSPRMIVIARK
jgi:SAM-dependent methyltransferase